MVLLTSPYSLMDLAHTFVYILAGDARATVGFECSFPIESVPGGRKTDS